jgi:hypothetical protein
MCQVSFLCFVPFLLLSELEKRAESSTARRGEMSTCSINGTDVSKHSIGGQVLSTTNQY